MKSILDDLRDQLLLLVNPLRDVAHDLGTSNSVTDTDTESVVEQPEINDHLNARKKVTSNLLALLAEDDAHQTALRSTNRFLLNNTKDNFAILYRHVIIKDGIRGLWIRGSLDVDTARNDHLRICFPDHSGFGLIMAGMGTLLSQPGTHSKMF